VIRKKEKKQLSFVFFLEVPEKDRERDDFFIGPGDKGESKW